MAGFAIYMFRVQESGFGVCYFPFYCILVYQCRAHVWIKFQGTSFNSKGPTLAIPVAAFSDLAPVCDPTAVALLVDAFFFVPA